MPRPRPEGRHRPARPLGGGVRRLSRLRDRRRAPGCARCRTKTPRVTRRTTRRMAHLPPVRRTCASACSAARRRFRGYARSARRCSRRWRCLCPTSSRTTPSWRRWATSSRAATRRRWSRTWTASSRGTCGRSAARRTRRTPSSGAW